MNILTHPVHTAYEYDLAETGHTFYSLPLQGAGPVFWEHKCRPKPTNVVRIHSLEGAREKYDLILAHFPAGLAKFRNISLPMIYKEHGFPPFRKVPADWLSRIDAFSFATKAAAERYQMSAETSHKKAVIPLGMNVMTYSGYSGDGHDVLTVANAIATRPVKGLKNLNRLLDRFNFTIVGKGNGGLKGAVGSAPDFSFLIQQYRSHKVYINPSPILCMATLEAMAMGMPIVSFKLWDSDVIKHNVNGLLVDSQEQAVEAISNLLSDRKLATRLGASARRTIEEHFSHVRFQESWNSLFATVVSRSPLAKPTIDQP